MKTITILKPIKTTAAKTVFSVVVFCLFFGMLTNTVFGIGDSAQGATINAASCSQADVQAAIDLATMGDTVIVPAGECVWESGISITKGITLQGTGMSETIITADSGFTLIFSSGDDAVITGFHLKAPSTAEFIIHVCGYSWRIHHNKFECITAGAKICGVYARGTSGKYNPTGLVDNNIFINARSVSIGSAGLLTAGDSQNEIYAEALGLGGSSAFYVEDNIFTATVGGNVIDANYASSYVARFNNITMPDWGSHLESHSMQSPANRANRKWEIYGNTLIGVAEKWVPFFIRGGTGVIFNNELEGSFSNEKIYFDNVRTYKDVGGTAGLCDGNSAWDGNSDATGWPCRDQIGTGPDSPQWENDPPGAYSQASVPAYVWSNRNTSGAEMAVTVINGCGDHIKANRDYYESTTFFDGTSGVGTGTLANRPSTCTPGVAYWATDQGEWNSENPGPDGQLYKCTSTDTWELYYKPYIYPHPLRGESGTIAGTVTDSITGNPIEGAMVTDGTRSETTDANGNYIMEGLLTNIYTVSASASGYMPLSINGVVVTVNDTTIADFQLTEWPDLVGFWAFEESSGTTAYDSSENNNDGIIYGPTSISGKSGLAFQFDGTDDYITIPTSASLDGITDEITLIAWIKVPASSRHSIFERWLCGDVEERSFELDVKIGKVWFGLSGDGTNNDSQSLLSSLAVPSDTWTHVAATSDGSTMKIYINGVLDPETGTSPSSIHPSAADVHIGRWEFVSNEWYYPFNGTMDEAKIYRRALSAQEVEDDYNLAFVGIHKNLALENGLLEAYPNPFNYSTTISYRTTVTGKVVITIYNMSGQRIRTLVSETRQADHHSVVWDGTNATGGSAGSGVYYCTLNIDNNPVATKKLVLLR